MSDQNIQQVQHEGKTWYGPYEIINAGQESIIYLEDPSLRQRLINLSERSNYDELAKYENNGITPNPDYGDTVISPKDADYFITFEDVSKAEAIMDEADEKWEEKFGDEWFGCDEDEYEEIFLDAWQTALQ